MTAISRETIARRQKNYLDYLEALEIEFEKHPILDFGCGRGEWIRILSDNKINAVGVDSSSSMTEEAKNQGFNIYCQDGLEYLMRRAANSFGVITSFQVVEHLPFNSLMLFLDQAYRTLAKGGVIILETPNPENVEVGSCNFYLDPSHIKPIPPLTLQFLLEYRGFRDVEIVRLDERGEIVDDEFSVSFDYFVKGTK